ncbi:MAG: M3 family metallopeptidase [Thermoleophilia bacterium]
MPEDSPAPAGPTPFHAPWTLPHGLPPFAEIRAEHFRPAFRDAMAAHRAEVDAVAADPAPPTFANTVEALERSGRMLDRVASVFFNLTGSDTTPELDAFEAEVAPQLAAHRDAIVLDPALYARLREVWDGPDDPARTTEQRRLLDRYRKDFERAGAGLAPAAQARLRELNAELSTLMTAFKARLAADTNAAALHVTDPAELEGLPEDAIAAAAEAARAAGRDGHLITLVLPTGQPALARLRRRDVRERLHRASVERGLRGDANDTRGTLVRIAALRAERARLLGFAHHAAYVVADETAGSLDAVTTMLAGLVGPAMANARAEAAELEALLAADGEPGPLRPWDWAFYAERVRRERYEVDPAMVRDHLELARVIADGVFHAANALYGLTFTRREDLAGYHPDVEVHEVADAAGEPVGLFLADWFARPSKRGGAWMSTFADQSHLLGTRPVTVANMNIPRPPDGRPALLTADEVETAFHEFGHVLHGLLSDVRYPRLAGTAVPRDFVEFPSQVNEMWALWPDVLRRYARHRDTGDPLPQATVDRLIAARAYGEGYATTEYLAAALLDLAWHTRTADDPPVAPEDVEAFERAALEAHGLDPDLVPPRYRSTYFAHVWSSGGYAAAYWSYIWAEVLDADTAEWFAERGGLDRESGAAFAREVLSRGGAVDPMAAVERLLGRPPRVEPLLRRRGLAPAA